MTDGVFCNEETLTKTKKIFKIYLRPTLQKRELSIYIFFVKHKIQILRQNISCL